MVSTFVEPQDWVIEVSSETRAAAWQFSRSMPTELGRWTAYLNQLCLESCLIWIRDYLPSTNAWTNATESRSIWNFVNGSVITVGTVRIALIPTDAIDQTELEVPQEWIDIPQWAADYYLAVQIAESELRIYGYATHQELKASTYDPNDRTYCLDVEDLNADLNALWLSYPHFTADQTRATIAPIPTLPAAQADRLIERLSQVVLPRLEIPFTSWAALLENSSLRQRLYQPPIRLNQWLQGQIDAAWQLLDRILLPQQIAIAVRSPDAAQAIEGEIYRAKAYGFATGQIALVIGISPVSETERRIRLQIHSAGGATYLPGATQLRLLSENGSEIGRASAAVTETMQLQFRASEGESFQVEITCDGQTLTERFIL
ncbi:DUF1822 family protein [Cyanobacteria bacterium FACHB-63]|nr:DUF1822 family protein [Cyanobacteria bacterium FACHB-63]